MNTRTVNQMKDMISSSSGLSMTGSVGVIMAYDKYNNTATVAVTENDTDEIREILRNVPCPVNIGVQSVAPEPGAMAWVVFKNGKITSPLIVTFFNHRYDKFDYQRQTRAPYSVPTYLMD